MVPGSSFFLHPSSKSVSRLGVTQASRLCGTASFHRRDACATPKGKTPWKRKMKLRPCRMKLNPRGSPLLVPPLSFILHPFLGKGPRSLVSSYCALNFCRRQDGTQRKKQPAKGWGPGKTSWFFVQGQKIASCPFFRADRLSPKQQLFFSTLPYQKGAKKEFFLDFMEKTGWDSPLLTFSQLSPTEKLINLNP